MKFYYGMIEDGNLVSISNKIAKAENSVCCRIPKEAMKMLEENEIGYKEVDGKHMLMKTDDSKKKRRRKVVNEYKEKMENLVIEKLSVEALGDETKKIEAKIASVRVEYEAEKKSIRKDSTEEFELEVIENPERRIIGNVTEEGQVNRYHTPEMITYKEVKFNRKRGDKIFYTESEAEEAGFEPAKQPKKIKKKIKKKKEDKKESVESEEVSAEVEPKKEPEHIPEEPKNEDPRPEEKEKVVNSEYIDTINEEYTG